MDNLTKITDAAGKESSFTYGFGGVGFIAIGDLGASHALGAA